MRQPIPSPKVTSPTAASLGFTSEPGPAFAPGATSRRIVSRSIGDSVTTFCVTTGAGAGTSAVS